MKEQEVKILLEKYFRAETSLQEEQKLRAYFSGEEIAEGLLPYRPLFSYFAKNTQNNLSDDFEQQLLIKMQKTPGRNKKHISIHYLAYAAAIALLLAALLWLTPPFAERQQPATADTNSKNINWEKYQPATEEEALQETIEALHLLAEKLNSSKKKAGKELRKVEKVTRILEN